MIRPWSKQVLRTLASALIVAFVTAIAYGTHSKSFVAGFLYLLPIMLIAFKWGFLEASIASVLAVGCLDYFFTEPLFHFYMSDPQDWIALTSFEATFLVVSQLADRLKRHSIETGKKRDQVEKLYLMSRDVLLLNRGDATGHQLVRLIVHAFDLDGASLWDARELRMDQAGALCIPEEEVRATYFHQRHSDNTEQNRFHRVLFIGSRAIGAVSLAANSTKSLMDAQSADAIASLAALALERSHSFKAESEAEAARQSEQLRSAVLDGLAHAFKTPLSTIQGASSGLLEIGPLNTAQEELAILINQEALHLGDLTAQALQTAKTEDEFFHVRKEKICIVPLLKELSDECVRYSADQRLSIQNDLAKESIWADSRLVKLALLELIDNASKYSLSEARISLRASASKTDVTFSVQNEGSYIPPEERRRIFRRFYRSPGSQFRAPGTGIGLSFVKRIAEAHSGQVWVDSDPDTGTTFFLTLPARTGGASN